MSLAERMNKLVKQTRDNEYFDWIGHNSKRLKDIENLIQEAALKGKDYCCIWVNSSELNFIDRYFTVNGFSVSSTWKGCNDRIEVKIDWSDDSVYGVGVSL